MVTVGTLAEKDAETLALTRARLLRALRSDDMMGAAAVLASIAMPTTTEGRSEFASWLSSITLTRPTKDAFVNAAVGVSFALLMSSAQSGPVPLAVQTAVQAISDHVANLQRTEQLAQARQQRLVIIGAVVLVLIAIVVGGAFVAVRALEQNVDAITMYLLEKIIGD